MHEKGGLDIKVRAGNIHSVLELDNRMPMVCAALRTVHQHTDGVVLIEEKAGPDVLNRPPNGANVWYTYTIA